MTVIERLRRLGWPVLMALVLMLLAAVIALEVVTGRDVNVAELYLVPIGVMTFARGFRSGLAIAVAALALGFATDVARLPHGMHPIIPIWNWTIRVGSFVAFAALLASMADRLVRETVLARTDPLTGAVNRVAFRELLGVGLDEARRSGGSLALGYMDLDKFKEVNDRLGHAEGDRVLRAVVEMSRHALRRSDLVFRIGGDEFAWILPTADAPTSNAIAERVREVWNERAQREGWPVRLSIGIATLPADACDADALVRAADRAMYDAKRSGGDRVKLVVASLSS